MYNYEALNSNDKLIAYLIYSPNHEDLYTTYGARSNISKYSPYNLETIVPDHLITTNLDSAKFEVPSSGTGVGIPTYFYNKVLYIPKGVIKIKTEDKIITLSSEESYILTNDLTPSKHSTGGNVAMDVHTIDKSTYISTEELKVLNDTRSLNDSQLILNTKTQSWIDGGTNEIPEPKITCRGDIVEGYMCIVDATHDDNYEQSVKFIKL